MSDNDKLGRLRPARVAKQKLKAHKTMVFGVCAMAMVFFVSQVDRFAQGVDSIKVFQSQQVDDLEKRSRVLSMVATRSN